MIFSKLGNYQALVSLDEYATPGYKTPTGFVHSANAIIQVIKVQENVPGLMEWGQLKNGNWVTLLQNGKQRVKFLQAVTPPPPPPDPTEPYITNIIYVNSVGGIRVVPQ